MKRKRKNITNTSLSVIEYAMLVNAMSEEFFNLETGEYQPHLGNLNAMRVFYNTFYKDDTDEAIADALDMDEVTHDEYFIEAFNNAISFPLVTKLDFANLYKDVLDIVESKKTSFGRLFMGVKNGFQELTDILTPAMSDESIDKIFSVVKELSNGNVDMTKIVDTYGKNISKNVKSENK